MRALLSLLLLSASVAQADELLRCELARGGSASERLESTVSDGSAEAQTKAPNAQGLALDSSVGPTSYFVVLDDVTRGRHAAFSGTSASISPEGARLSIGDASASCLRVPDSHTSLAPPPAAAVPDYFVCMLDDAHFVNGDIAETTRRLFRVTSPISSHLPVRVAAEDEAVAFRVSYVSFDPFRGLEVSLTDKASGETVSYSGPGRSMNASFLLGLTIGDRAVDARFLRLGCVKTDTPSAFK